MSPHHLRSHIVVRVGDGDAYLPAPQAYETTLPLAFQAPSALATSRVSDSVWLGLDQHALSPAAPAIDFYRMAAAVYAADARILRDAAFDRWTRDLVLHLPVSDLAAWERVRPSLVRLLQFLTGDRWELVLRPGAPSRPPVDRRVAAGARAPDIGAVSLLSGGLDSFVGALDGFADGKRLLLVSHNAAGPARFSSPAQDAVLRAIEQVAGQPVAHLKMTVSPPPRADGVAAEPSQRSRSIIFIALGVLAATAYPAGTPLVVAENGFVSLNVPMTYGRLGSLSTRTTHPHTLALISEVLVGLGLAVPLVTPYRFMTKGQMLVETRAREVLATTCHATNSCARSYDRNASANRPQAHCGYCVPCIIRRAAMHHAGLDDVARYRYDVRTERATLVGSPDLRKDPWAFEMALARAERRATVTDVLRAGPLAGPPADVDRYVQVYRNGLNEVSEFVRGRPLFRSE